MIDILYIIPPEIMVFHEYQKILWPSTGNSLPLQRIHRDCGNGAVRFAHRRNACGYAVLTITLAPWSPPNQAIETFRKETTDSWLLIRGWAPGWVNISQPKKGR